MDLRCDVCHTLLGPSGMVQGLGVGQCPACNARLDLDRERVPGPVVPHERLPVRYQIRQDRDLIEIEWRWRGPLAWILLGFTCLWDGAVGFWLHATAGLWVMQLFAALHVLAGVGLTYLTAAMLLNKTRLAAGPTTLLVSHGPLPLRPSVELSVDGIRQLYVVATRHEKGAPTYSLRALDARGRSSVVLVESIDALTEARFLEQKLEAFMGITPAAVEGEVPPELPTP